MMNHTSNCTIAKELFDIYNNLRLHEFLVSLMHGVLGQKNNPLAPYLKIFYPIAFV